MQALQEIFCDAQTVPAEVLHGRNTPLVLRQLVAHWPLVATAAQSDLALAQHLKQCYPGVPVQAFFAGASAGGRFFYNDDVSGFNFEQRATRLDTLLDTILSDPAAPCCYMGSTTAEYCLPGITQQNPLPLPADTPLISVWIGNQSHVVAHYDIPDNLACVAAGQRRFTLFAPEQLENLYIGPLEFTPAGQPVSMVDARAPDFTRFPRYAQALANAYSAELNPGDAIFIPSMWWHQVEALAPLNMLVNYWWRSTPSYHGLPSDALLHAILSIRDLPETQRNLWRVQFEHYVFNATAQTAAHIPAPQRGILSGPSELNARKLRSLLLNRLNR